MSDSARSSARTWANTRTVQEIKRRVAELEAAPAWKGHEFDDVRTRHMLATTINALEAVLCDRARLAGTGP